MTLRLQKFLAQAGICSRRKGEAYIGEGRVCVNGIIVTQPGTKVDPETDTVTFDGKTVKIASEKPRIYIMLNKPKGYISSCSHKGEKIILDLIPVTERIYPVGRLDKDSVGLILLTNDGALHNRLSHPSFNHEKEYLVKTGQPIPGSALISMENGMILDGKKTRRAKVRRLSKTSFIIILKQGINRQIRRMVKKTGNRVIHLKRVRMGSLKLGSLARGSWRYLTPREVKALKRRSN